MNKESTTVQTGALILFSTLAGLSPFIFAFMLSCERVHKRPSFDQAPTKHIKCWSGGEPIFDKAIYRARFFDSRIDVSAADGEYEMRADCIVYPNSP